MSSPEAVRDTLGYLWVRTQPGKYRPVDSIKEAKKELDSGRRGTSIDTLRQAYGELKEIRVT